MPESSGDLSDRAADSPEHRDSLAGGAPRNESESPGRKGTPFVIGVIGDFSAAQPDRAPLRERRFLPVSRGALDELIAAIRPRLAYSVPNTMGGDSPTLAIQLEFHSLSDFDPFNVARQIAPLRKLLELRERLVDLLSKIGDTSTRRALGELMAGSNVQKDSEREPQSEESVSTDSPPPHEQPRVKIDDQFKPGGTKMKELPFRVGVLGDLSDERNADLQQREFVALTPDDFENLFNSFDEFFPSAMAKSNESSGQLREVRARIARLLGKLKDAEEKSLLHHFWDEVRRRANLGAGGDIGGAPCGSISGDFDWELDDSDVALLMEMSRVAAAAHSPFLASAPKSATIDENVQFTLYRPRVVEPDTWHSLLVFVHLDDLPLDVSTDEPLPIDVVRQRAATLLDDSMGSYRETSAESELPLPREGEILLVPQMHGVIFHPPQQSLLWVGKVCHREFQLKATHRLESRTARGHLDVFLGPLILASIPISFRVGSGVRAPETLAGRDTARPYHKIFASYSRRDAHVVECCERITAALGHKLMLDTKSLRAGEVWSEGLEGLIREADVFQLFWSQNSMYSPFVEREWRFALSLQRNHFVRPTYWEQPFPENPTRNLPPPELARLHFHFLGRLGEPAEDDASGTAAAEDATSSEHPSKEPPKPVRGGSVQRRLSRNRKPRADIQYDVRCPSDAAPSDLPAGSPTEEADAPQQPESQSVLDQVLATTVVGEREGDSRDMKQELDCLISEVARDAGELDQTCAETIANAIARINERVAEQVADVVREPAFQRLEGTWRGLAGFLEHAGDGMHTYVKVMDCSKAELAEDVLAAHSHEGSVRHGKVSDELRSLEGDPLGVLIVDYRFDAGSADDASLLNRLFEIGAANLCPILAEDCSPMRSGTTSEDLSDEARRDAYKAWQSFREDAGMCYLGLTVPRFILRNPYGKAESTSPDFGFEETMDAETGTPTTYSWTNAAYAFGSQMSEAFRADDWLQQLMVGRGEALSRQQDRVAVARQLQQWITQYWSHNVEGSAHQLPSRGTEIEQRQEEKEGDEFEASFEMRPHYRLEGLPVELTPVTELRPSVPGDPSKPEAVGPARAEPSGDTSKKLERPIDDELQFTVYRPRAVIPERWYSMLVFAHLDASPQLATVQEQAATILGVRRDYGETSQLAENCVPLESQITLVPSISKFTFHPSHQTLLWLGQVERGAEFKLEARDVKEGTGARGVLSAYVGSLLIATMPLRIRISSQLPREAEAIDRETVRRYQRVFASYSHRDRAIVESCGRVVRSLGHKYLRDTTDLRAGERWSTQLEQLIREADVFQLFWSRNSMYSPHVAREWRFALGLDREEFVRPTYWEEPLPVDRQRNLPPPALSQLHFQRLVLPESTS